MFDMLRSMEDNKIAHSVMVATITLALIAKRLALFYVKSDAGKEAQFD